MRLLLLVSASLLMLSAAAHAQSEKKKTDLKAGLTSTTGNRCPGGTFDKCYAANIKAGWKPSSASSHCAKTCN